MSVCLVVCLFSHSDSLGSTHDFFQIHCSFSFYCSHARCPLNPTSNLSMPPPSERRTSQSTLWGGYKGLVNLPVLCSPPHSKVGGYWKQIQIVCAMCQHVNHYYSASHPQVVCYLSVDGCVHLLHCWDQSFTSFWPWWWWWWFSARRHVHWLGMRWVAWT